jgi:hypothetical protein
MVLVNEALVPLGIIGLKYAAKGELDTPHSRLMRTSHGYFLFCNVSKLLKQFGKNMRILGELPTN